jgi:hypothetical protein
MWLRPKEAAGSESVGAGRGTDVLAAQQTQDTGVPLNRRRVQASPAVDVLGAGIGAFGKQLSHQSNITIPGGLLQLRRQRRACSLPHHDRGDEPG